MWLRSRTDRVSVIRGREEVLGKCRELTRLCESSEQPGTLDQLEYLFSLPAFRRKRPTLLLIHSSETGSAEPIAAVLLYEYLLFGLGTRIYTADFQAAARTVVARPYERLNAAIIAADELFHRGALIAQISYEGDEAQAVLSATAGPHRKWASRSRQMSCYMPLEADLEASLAQLGKRTRRNLRHFHRLAAAELGAALVISPEISKEEFIEFNRASDYAVPDHQAADRFDTLQRCPIPLFIGLRGANGEWLAFLGGHRRGPDLFLEWQMNRSDLARYSLSTAMRAHLMEYAVELGCRRLYFVRGTSSSMVNSLVPEKLVDFVLTRPGVPDWVLNKVACTGHDLPAYTGEIPALFPNPQWAGESQSAPADSIGLPESAA